MYFWGLPSAAFSFIFYQFSPSNAKTQVRVNRLLGMKENEQTLEGNENPILNREKPLLLFIRSGRSADSNDRRTYLLLLKSEIAR